MWSNYSECAVHTGWRGYSCAFEMLCAGSICERFHIKSLSGAIRSGFMSVIIHHCLRKGRGPHHHHGLLRTHTKQPCLHFSVFYSPPVVISTCDAMSQLLSCFICWGWG